jgi:hypothetical protein
MNPTTTKTACELAKLVLFTECAAEPNPAKRSARLYQLAKLADDYARKFAQRFPKFNRPEFLRACGFDTTAEA